LSFAEPGDADKRTVRESTAVVLHSHESAHLEGQATRVMTIVVNRQFGMPGGDRGESGALMLN
jgi:hypothetical protein